MIVFHNVTKEFEDRTVLDNVKFKIDPGEFVCITGPSGAGKSTIIHMLIRAELPTTGTIEVDGADITQLPSPLLQLYRRRTGIVFQDYKLLADRTVYENVAFAMEACGEKDETIATRVVEVLEALGISERTNAFPRELSGGEKTRVALARAIVNRPSILIADEPTGNIDPDQSIAILRLLREIHSQGTTVILATHDKLIVDALGVRVLRLEGGKLVRDSVGGYVAENEIISSAHRAPGTSLVASPESATENQSEGEAPISEEIQKKVPQLPPQGRHVPASSRRGQSSQRTKSGGSSKKENDEPEDPSKGHVKPVEIQ